MMPDDNWPGNTPARRRATDDASRLQAVSYIGDMPQGLLRPVSRNLRKFTVFLGLGTAISRTCVCSLRQHGKNSTRDSFCIRHHHLNEDSWRGWLAPSMCQRVFHLFRPGVTI